MRVVTLRDGRQVGEDRRCAIVAEAGINHDGQVEVALELCRVAKAAGAEYVKFQKKTPRLCVPRHQWDIPKQAPWGEVLSYIEYKERMELGSADYDRIAATCRDLGIGWTASVWDEPSLAFLLPYDPPFIKVPSACLTDLDLLGACRRSGRPVVASTGMSTEVQIDRAVSILDPDRLVLLHCTSTYPAPTNELNLNVIPWLHERFHVPVGFSDHSTGVWAPLATAALGACLIEKHFTLNRAALGTDHGASCEPGGLARIVRDIRNWEHAKGDGIKKVFDSERAVLHKLRRVP